MVAQQPTSVLSPLSAGQLEADGPESSEPLSQALEMDHAGKHKEFSQPSVVPPLQ